MFCPQCHAEYRPGFTHCTDCDVPLVASLPGSEEASPPNNSSGSIRTLWEGEDLALHTTLLEHLKEAGIPFFNQPMGVFPGVRRGDPFPIQPMTRFGYQVAVLSSDLAAAKQILERLLEEEPQDMELPAEDEEENKTPERTPSQPGALTREIWSESDNGLAEFLVAALEENGIPARVELHEQNASVCISSEDEARAREIVSEIVDGAPPE